MLLLAYHVACRKWLPQLAHSIALGNYALVARIFYFYIKRTAYAGIEFQARKAARRFIFQRLLYVHGNLLAHPGIERLIVFPIILSS